jgi:hypothetical protein
MRDNPSERTGWTGVRGAMHAPIFSPRTPRPDGAERAMPNMMHA